MSVWGAVAGGFVGTLVLTTALRAASELGLTRMDLPFLLGTAFTADRTRPRRSATSCTSSRGRLRARLLRRLRRHRPQRLVRSGPLFGLLHGLFAGTALMNILLPAVHPRMGTSSSAADAAR